MSRLLLIDPDATLRSSNAQTLENNGFSVDAVANLRADFEPEAYRAIVATTAAVPDANTLAQLVQVPVVLLAEGGSIPEAVSAIKQGAADYLQLPLDGDQLVAAVERAFSHVSNNDKGSNARRKSFPMVGNCEAMQQLFNRIGKVAPTDSTVLIEGESGTGKELVARALHDSSLRSHAPLITLNCATVPSDLIESELFGFGGDDASVRRGLVDAANGGTLFLDEIAELPLEAQTKLLRLVLQGESRPVGSSETHSIDVRLIVATHRNLARLTESGQFREDLYYRLNVVKLPLPPLRERREDIPQLAATLLERTTEKLSRDKLSFSKDAMQAMLGYRWPGNVREMENAIERAAILCEGGEITADLLAIEADLADESADAASEVDENTSLEDYFVKFVREHEDHLTETEIADKLGISRKSLWERRQRLNIPRRKSRQKAPRS